MKPFQIAVKAYCKTAVAIKFLAISLSEGFDFQATVCGWHGFQQRWRGTTHRKHDDTVNGADVRRCKRGHGREAEILTTDIRRDATKAARAEHTDTFKKIFFFAVEHSQEVSPETRTSLREERGVIAGWLRLARHHRDPGSAGSRPSLKVVLFEHSSELLSMVELLMGKKKISAAWLFSRRLEVPVEKPFKEAP